MERSKRRASRVARELIKGFYKKSGQKTIFKLGSDEEFLAMNEKFLAEAYLALDQAAQSTKNQEISSPELVQLARELSLSSDDASPNEESSSVCCYPWWTNTMETGDEHNNRPTTPHKCI